jgi:hypothetical protein
MPSNETGSVVGDGAAAGGTDVEHPLATMIRMMLATSLVRRVLQFSAASASHNIVRLPLPLSDSELGASRRYCYAIGRKLLLRETRDLWGDWLARLGRSEAHPMQLCR